MLCSVLFVLTARHRSTQLCERQLALRGLVYERKLEPYYSTFAYLFIFLKRLNYHRKLVSLYQESRLGQWSCQRVATRPDKQMDEPVEL